MSEMDLKEAVARLGKQIAEQVKKEGYEKASKNENFQALFTEYMEKQNQLLSELGAANQQQAEDELIQNSGRKDGGFSLDDLDPDKEEEKAKNLDPITQAKIARQKILLSKRTLEKLYGSTVAEKIEEFKELQDDVYVVGALLAGKTREPYSKVVRETQIYKLLQERLQKDQDLQKALYTSGSGQGAEWIPTAFSSQMLERITLELQIANQFVTITMPTNPYKYPIAGTGASAYLIPESTSDTASKIKATTPGTGNFEFIAKKIASRILFSEEMNEDSIIPMIPFVRDSLGVAIAEGFENALLNGDDSTTHQDSDVTDANDVRKAFKGLRYFALNNAGTATLSFSGGAPTTALLRSLRKLLGKYGVKPGNLFYAVGPKVFIQMLSIDEVKTLQNFGQQATVLTGVLPRFDGIPIIVSEFVREDLNASGVYDGTTTNLGVIHLTDKRGFMIGQRLGVTLNTVYDYETDQVILVAKYRVAFKDPYDALSASHIQTVLGYNVQT